MTYSNTNYLFTDGQVQASKVNVRARMDQERPLKETVRYFIEHPNRIAPYLGQIVSDLWPTQPHDRTNSELEFDAARSRYTQKELAEDQVYSIIEDIKRAKRKLSPDISAAFDPINGLDAIADTRIISRYRSIEHSLQEAVDLANPNIWKGCKHTLTGVYDHKSGITLYAASHALSSADRPSHELHAHICTNKKSENNNKYDIDNYQLWAKDIQAVVEQACKSQGITTKPSVCDKVKAIVNTAPSSDPKDEPAASCILFEINYFSPFHIPETTENSWIVLQKEDKSKKEVLQNSYNIIVCGEGMTVNLPFAKKLHSYAYGTMLQERYSRIFDTFDDVKAQQLQIAGCAAIAHEYIGFQDNKLRVDKEIKTLEPRYVETWLADLQKSSKTLNEKMSSIESAVGL